MICVKQMIQEERETERETERERDRERDREKQRGIQVCDICFKMASDLMRQVFLRFPPQYFHYMIVASTVQLSLRLLQRFYTRQHVLHTLATWKQFSIIYLSN